jgi:DNA replication protein DnaC
MNNNHTLEQLRLLRLQGMHDTYKHILSTPLHQHPEAHDLIAMLTDVELNAKRNKRTDRLISRSKMRYRALMTDVYCSKERNLSAQQIQLLGQSTYMNNAENIIITGATGCGKTYLACALGQQACLLGNTVLYFNLNKFIEHVRLSKLEGTYNKYISTLANPKLLIMDEFGIAPMNYEAKLALLELLEERYNKTSTVIIGQIPVANWHEYINEPTIADAILDRITANAHRIELKGESLRTKKITNIATEII